jgi:hypothetical protein
MYLNGHMENRSAMNKIVRILVFFSLSGVFWDCKKNSPQPGDTDPFGVWKFQGESGDRAGAGYAWRLSPDNETDQNGRFDIASTRLFYLNDAFVREVTLTVTKREESSFNPSFNIYGRFQQCLLMSDFTVSSGGFAESGIFQRDGMIGSAVYSGITWTPDLAKSPVNTKATCKFKVYIDSQDTLCTEGFVQADMTAPAAVNSAGNYSDGDHLYFVKK